RAAAARASPAVGGAAPGRPAPRAAGGAAGGARAARGADLPQRRLAAVRGLQAAAAVLAGDVRGWVLRRWPGAPAHAPPRAPRALRIPQARAERHLVVTGTGRAGHVARDTGGSAPLASGATPAPGRA